MPAGIQEYPNPPDRYPHNATLNIMHRLQQIRHPVGDIVDYLGALQPHPGYDLSSLISAGQSSAMSPLATLGSLTGMGMTGYTL